MLRWLLVVLLRGFGSGRDRRRRVKFLNKLLLAMVLPIGRTLALFNGLLGRTSPTDRPTLLHAFSTTNG